MTGGCSISTGRILDGGESERFLRGSAHEKGISHDKRKRKEGDGEEREEARRGKGSCFAAKSGYMAESRSERKWRPGSLEGEQPGREGRSGAGGSYEMWRKTLSYH